MSINGRMMSSNRDDWETPRRLFDRFDSIFDFQLDAAASAANTKCARYFDKTNSAFTQPWTPGPVWLNPPYGDDMPRWITHACVECQRRAQTVVCLVKVATRSAWFNVIWDHAKAILFLSHRLKFEGGKSDAPFDSAVAIFAPKLVLELYPNFKDEVADLGRLVPRDASGDWIIGGSRTPQGTLQF